MLPKDAPLTPEEEAAVCTAMAIAPANGVGVSTPSPGPHSSIATCNGTRGYDDAHPPKQIGMV